MMGRRDISLTVRAAVMAATRDAFQFRPVRLGEVDCAQMIAHGLEGYGIDPQRLRFGAYNNERKAKAALRRAGFDSLEAVIDGYGFERIGHARAWLGDILCFPADSGPFPALGWMLNNGNVQGMHAPTGTCRILKPDWRAARADEIFAWRVTLPPAGPMSFLGEAGIGEAGIGEAGPMADAA